MKAKTWLFALAASMAVTAANAQMSPYAGMNVSFNQGTYDTELEDDWSESLGSYDTDYDGYAIGLTIGTELNSGLLMEASYTRTSIEPDSVNREHVFYGTEAQLKMPLTQEAVRPYLGAGIGFWIFDDSEKYRTDEDRDLLGFGGSLMAGILLQANRQVHLDGGLRYRKILWEEYEDGFVTINDEVTMLELYLGAQIRF